MNHIFQDSRAVYFKIPTLNSGGTGITIVEVDFSSDTYSPYISGYVSYEPERIVKKSPINGKIFTKTLGWRCKVNIEINIVTAEMLALVQTLISNIVKNIRTQDAINALNGNGDSLTISISYSSTNSRFINGLYLSSSIEPEYLNKSIMAGEKLELEFESKDLFQFLPTATYDRILINTTDFLITNSGDKLLIIR